MSETRMSEDDIALRLTVTTMFDALVERVEKVVGAGLKVGGLNGLIRPQDASMVEIMYRGEVQGMIAVLYSFRLTYPGLADDLDELRARITELIDGLRNGV